VKEPVCRENAAEFDPAAITIDDGAVSRLLAVDTRTLAPAAGAFFVNVTVQAPEVDKPSVTWPQTSEDISAGATRAMVVLAWLPL
jgi:hypothetical protein